MIRAAASAGFAAIGHHVMKAGRGLIATARARLHKARTERFRRYCSDLPNEVPDPVFVKVGAGDGTTGDPCSDILLASPRWRGLLIEPVAYCFSRLRANFSDARRFSLEQVAIGPKAAETVFYYVDQAARDHVPGLPVWYDQLGSFDRAHIVKHLGGVLEPFIVPSIVKVLPLSEVLRRHGIRDCHLLHIDTEGYDYDVLMTLDFAACSPILIFVEHKHVPARQQARMRALLRAQGYAVRDCGGDYFAVNTIALRRIRRRGKLAPASS